MIDSEIVDLYINRNEDAIKESSIKYSSKLRKISNTILLNEKDVNECENDTYMSAWKLIPPNEPREYLYLFLAKIIRNLSLNYYKKNNSIKRKAIVVELTKELEECIGSYDVEDNSILDKDFTQLINKFLTKEKEDTRNIFIRRYFYMETIKEIAYRYDMSEGKIKSNLFRSRNKLRFFFEKEGYKL